MSARELDLYERVGWLAGEIPKNIFTEPDDDWTPVAFIQDTDGDVSMPIPLEQFMINDQTKDLLAEVGLPGLILGMRARTIVMVLSVWAANVTKEEWDEGPYVAPSQRSDRKERLMLMEITCEGVQRHSFAEIIRHEGAPPTLGEWEEIEGIDSFGGRFVDPIVRALKAVT